MSAGRIDWVDYSKGICIIMVVMMHSVLNYGEMVHGEGWMHAVVAWAKPLRMPDFFLISGLFLHRSIFGSAASYFDRKVLHFAYFYVLWLAIQTVAFDGNLLLSNPLALVGIYLKGLVVPASSLWFIHELIVFYVITRLLRNVPVHRVFLAAAFLQVMHSAGLVNTGWSVTNRVAEWYVFFFAGYAYSPMVFQFARAVSARGRELASIFLVWFCAHTGFVLLGAGSLPFVSLLLGLCGALAIVAVGVKLMDWNTGRVFAYAGRNSIVIYLSFFIPMKITQKVLAATGLIPDIGTATLVITLVGVGVPLVFHHFVKGTPLNALYVRPQMFRMKSGPSSRRGSLLSPPPVTP